MDFFIKKTIKVDAGGNIYYGNMKVKHMQVFKETFRLMF